MTERRYDDEELSAIFRMATEESDGTTAGDGGPAGDSASGAGVIPGEARGFTLAELQEIGADAGIAPEAVARAAASLEVRSPEAGPVVLSVPNLPAGRVLGIPYAVSRTAELRRALTDEEWRQFVGVLRDTFAARGTVRSEAGVREWSNGNLSVSLAPWQDGERLSMRTRKGNAPALPAVGGVLITLALGFSVLGLVGIEPWVEVLALMTMTGLPGLALLGFGTLSLGRWARTRERQFEALAEQVQRLAAGPED